LKEHDPVRRECPEEIYVLMKGFGGVRPGENLCLDTKNTLVKEVTAGSTERVLVRSKDVCTSAILRSSYDVIVVHDHPGGGPEPCSKTGS
jgi:hypothetical protein